MSVRNTHVDQEIKEVVYSRKTRSGKSLKVFAPYPTNFSMFIVLIFREPDFTLDANDLQRISQRLIDSRMHGTYIEYLPLHIGQIRKPCLPPLLVYIEFIQADCHKQWSGILCNSHGSPLAFASSCAVALP